MVNNRLRWSKRQQACPCQFILLIHHYAQVYRLLENWREEFVNAVLWKYGQICGQELADLSLKYSTDKDQKRYRFILATFIRTQVKFRLKDCPLMLRSVITGTGSFIPPDIQSNTDFFQHTFYTDAGHPLDIPAPEVIEKFRKITGITDRRYAVGYYDCFRPGCTGSPQCH